jgi:Fe2+ transport system protein FeoA
MNFFRKNDRQGGDLIKEDPEKCANDCCKRHRHRRGRDETVSSEGDRETIALSSCPAGSLCIISGNKHKMTKEIGLNPGKTISVFKNEPSDSNMIICLDMTRYIIAKAIASRITVKAAGENPSSGCD